MQVFCSIKCKKDSHSIYRKCKECEKTFRVAKGVLSEKTNSKPEEMKMIISNMLRQQEIVTWSIIKGIMNENRTMAN